MQKKEIFPFDENILNQLISFAKSNGDNIDLIGNYEEISLIIGYNYLEKSDLEEFLNNKFIFEIHLDFLKDYLPENIRKLKFSEEIKFEDISSISGHVLFYNPMNYMCITYSGLPDSCDELVFIDKDKSEKNIIRPSHHDLLGSLHSYYMGYNDTFKFRLLLEIIGGYKSAFPNVIKKAKMSYSFYTISDELYETSIDDSLLREFLELGGE